MRSQIRSPWSRRPRVQNESATQSQIKISSLAKRERLDRIILRDHSESAFFKHTGQQSAGFGIVVHVKHSRSIFHHKPPFLS